jgi:hypothetical protein
MMSVDAHEWALEDMSSLGERGACSEAESEEVGEDEGASEDESEEVSEEEDSEEEDEEESEEEDEEESEEEEDEEESEEDEEEESESDEEDESGWTDEDGISSEFEDGYSGHSRPLQSTGSAESILNDEKDHDDSDEEEDSQAGAPPTEVFDDEPWGKAESVHPTFDTVHGSVPRDEEAGLSTIDNRHMPSERYGDRSRKSMIAICCCCCLLVVVGVIIGLVAGGNDPASEVQTAPTQAPVTNPPTVPPIPPQPTVETGSPTSMPVPTATKFPRLPTKSPTISPAPTAPIPEEIILLPDADTYIESGVLADFGFSETLRVQSDAFALISFNITELPAPKEIFLREKTAILRLSHIESDADRGNTTLRVSRLPSTPLSVESLTSDTFVPAGGTFGPIFELAPTDLFALVDITDLLFGQAPFIRSTQEKQIFLIIQSLEASEDHVDIFQSRESDKPPQLIVGLKRGSPSPTVTAAPSSTFRPSLRPSRSPAPSVSTNPTTLPSELPSAVPTVTSRPTAMSDENNQTSSKPSGGTGPPKPPSNGGDFTFFPTTTNMTKTPEQPTIL